jgi:antitoxin (DNA-binding transcriptional repressor) of toxin-antitoxin stability system
MTHFQTITHKGKPVAVIVPHEEWLKIQEMIEDADDVRVYDAAIRNFKADNRRTYPSEVVYAIADGKNPIKAFREWRRLTQAQLAAKAGMSVAVLSHLETGVRRAGLKSLQKLSKALDVPLDLLASVKNS